MGPRGPAASPAGQIAASGGVACEWTQAAGPTVTLAAGIPTTYTVAEIADRITTRLLVLAPENEQFWPGQSAELVELTAEVSTLAHFTAAEGADGHCQPLARALTAERMFDWLDEQLA